MPSRLRHRLDPLTFTTISAGSGDADSVSPEVARSNFRCSPRSRGVPLRLLERPLNRQQRNNTPAPSGAASSGDLQASLVPRRVGSRARRLANLPRRSHHPTHPERSPVHAEGNPRRRRQRIRFRALQRIGTYQQLAVPWQGRSPSTSQLCSSLCRGRNRRRSWPRAVQSRSRIMVLDGAGSLLQPIRHRHRCRRPGRTYPRFRTTRRPQRRDCCELVSRLE